MRQSHSIATLALAIVVALAVVALVTAGTNDVAPGVARFRETRITYFRGNGGAGAVEGWRTQVWLPHKAQTVGTGVIACIHVDESTTVRECNGTYILPRGRIQVAGEIITRAAFTLSIIGGTGVYVPATGVMTVQPGGLVTFFLS